MSSVNGLDTENFDYALASLGRSLEAADPGKRAAVYENGCRELIRFATLGILPKPDVFDGMTQVGAAYFEEAERQVIVTAAISNPVDLSRKRDALLSGTAVPPKLEALTLKEFLALVVKPRAFLLAPILSEKGLLMLYGPRGLGKTLVALLMGYAAATQSTALRWGAPAKRNVLFIDGEMPLATLQDRIAALVKAGRDFEPPDNFKILAADYFSEGIPNLATPEGQGAIDHLLVGTDLLIIDNLSTLANAGRDNEAESWTPIQSWLLSLRRRGIAVILVHHAGKGGQQRGTSRREDILDTVIALRRPQDYRAEDGARFEVHMEKARGVFGDDAKPFVAKLETRDGVAVWTTQDLEDADLSRVMALIEQDRSLSLRDIAEETGLSKSTVDRLKKKGLARALNA